MQQDEIPQIVNFTRVALLGSTRCAKSTLLGVLTKGVNDDGNGYARNLMLNYDHEIKKGGQTEAIVYEVLGFDKDGKQVFSNQPLKNKGQYQEEVFANSNSYAYILDTCGDEKYFKHTLAILNRSFFNLAIIVVSATEGMTKITGECIILCQQFQIPFIVVLTKIDQVENIQLKQKNINKIHNLLSNSSLFRKLTIPNNPQKCANEMFAKLQKQNNCKGMICPLFEINNLTREGIDGLLTFLFHFKNTDQLIQGLGTIEDQFQMLIFYTCSTKKINAIPYGIITHGTIKLDQIVSVGLDENKQTICCKVASIQNVRNQVNSASVGQLVSLQLQPVLQQNINYNAVKFITDPKINIPLINQFWANISLFPGPTTASLGYKPILQLLNIEKQINLKQIMGEKQSLRSGDCALVLLEFFDGEQQPIMENTQFLLRCLTTVAYGQVVDTKQFLINDEL